jgi:diguanylate cyclase (GGDEF)-like protein
MTTLRTGSFLTIAIAVGGFVYAAASWSVGNRPLMCSILVFAVLTAVLIELLPMERVVAGRWRETFFMAWTASSVGLVILLASIDPAEPTPLVLPLFMPLVYTGVSYPRSSARAASVLVVVSYAVFAVVKGEDPAWFAFLEMSLIGAAAMCLWQQGNRDRQRAELDAHREELARASRTDPLTGTLNRRGFEERLARELAQAARDARPLTLALLDLDDFKAVNDRDGHAAGDRLLCETVTRLEGALRPMDAIGRLGGDEFAAVLPGTGAEEAAAVVGRLEAALAGHVPASFGQATFPVDGITAEALMHVADGGLYVEKGARKGRVRAPAR